MVTQATRKYATPEVGGQTGRDLLDFMVHALMVKNHVRKSLLRDLEWTSFCGFG